TMRMARSMESRNSDSAEIKTFSISGEALGVLTKMLFALKTGRKFDTSGSLRCHNAALRRRTHRRTPVSRNIEIKARIASVEALIPRVEAIASQGPVEIRQDDTYFVCSAGKLKLRAFSQSEGELI